MVNDGYEERKKRMVKLRSEKVMIDYCQPTFRACLQNEISSSENC